MSTPSAGLPSSEPPRYADRLLDATDPETQEDVVRRAAAVVQEGKVVVLPTDTVYGVGADAFDVVAVAMVLAAKHRGREMPPPVLVPTTRTVDGLAVDVPMYAKILMRQFWPGPLTLVLRAQPSLQWDLGETNGTVALRMPDDEIALSLLAETGPMAVTSANVTGQPAATTAEEALDQLGGAVACYLDGGPRTGGAPSTILDCTGEEPVLLRVGALSLEELRGVLGTTTLHEERPTTPTGDLGPDEDLPAEGGVPAEGADELAPGAQGEPLGQGAEGAAEARAHAAPAEAAEPVVEPASPAVEPASPVGSVRPSGIPTRSDSLTEVPAPGTVTNP